MISNTHYLKPANTAHFTLCFVRKGKSSLDHLSSNKALHDFVCPVSQYSSVPFPSRRHHDHQRRRTSHRNSDIGRLDSAVVQRTHPVAVIELVLVREIVQIEVLVLRTLPAAGIVNAVVYARLADALTAAVVEPPIARGAHRLTTFLALVPRHALRHVRDRAIDGDLGRVVVAWLQIVVAGVHDKLRSALSIGPVQRRIEIDRKREDLPPLLGVLLGGQHVEQVREALQLLDVRLLAQLVGRLVRLGTHLQTAAALGVQIAETLGTLLAARTVLHVTFATLS